VDNETEDMKGAVLAPFKIQSQNYPGGTEKNGLGSRDLNPEPITNSKWATVKFLEKLRVSKFFKDFNVLQRTLFFTILIRIYQ
jgi:hypothetical protein